MNQFLKIGLISLILPLVASAKVVESNRYADILPYMDNQTLLVTDIDNTLIRPVQEIGSDQWGTSIMDKLRKAGITEPMATDLGVSMFAAVQMNTKVQLVEPETAHHLTEALSKGAKIVGLTARPLYLIPRTLELLKSVGFPFQSEQISSFDGTKSVNGIIFAGSNNKGQVLKKYLSLPEYKNIHRVVFIDDKAHHTEAVDKALEGCGYDVISIRYGATDTWVKSFDAGKAEKEWNEYLKSGEL